MFVSKDGRVSGSIHRAEVAELYRNTDDEELRAYYRDLLGDSEEAESLDEPAEDSAEEAPEAEPEDDLDALREQYEAVSGAKADGRWGAERLREEIAAYEESEG